MPNMTALVEVGTFRRTPKVRGPLPPSRPLNEPLRSTVYMPFDALAIVTIT